MSWRGDGRDRISDFELDAQGEAIDLSSLDGVTDWADLNADHLHATESGSVIRAGSDWLFVDGVDPAMLSPDDFLF